MTTLFPDQTEIDPEKNYAEELIGEGKKYRDVGVAARSIIEKDNFIERLKAENAQMRASLKGEAKLDEFLDNLKRQVPNQPSVDANHETTSGQVTQNQQNENVTKGLSIEDVQRILEEKEAQKRVEANVNRVVEAVKNAFGSNYKHIIQQKADELGLDEAYMMDIAGKSPGTLLQLLGVDAQKGPQFVTPKSGLNTQGSGQKATTEKTKSYYTKLRKELGDARFFAPQIQNELHANATRLGDAFFDE